MKALIWILENFGTVIVFQAMNYLYGFKMAIIASVIFAVLELAIMKIRKRPITPFMAFSFTLILAFGAVDLYLDNSFFFKYESSIFNFVLAGISEFHYLEKNQSLKSSPNNKDE